MGGIIVKNLLHNFQGVCVLTLAVFTNFGCIAYNKTWQEEGFSKSAIVNNLFLWYFFGVTSVSLNFIACLLHFKPQMEGYTQYANEIVLCFYLEYINPFSTFFWSLVYYLFTHAGWLIMLWRWNWIFFYVD